jgi:hypothetical protein
MAAPAAEAASPSPIRSFTAAAVAFDPACGDVDGNIARIVAGIVAQRGASRRAAENRHDRLHLRRLCHD